MTISLKAEIRKIPTVAIKTQRKAGKIPAELYGKNQSNQHLFINQIILEKIFKVAGESTLIDLTIDQHTPVKVLIYNVQKDPVTNQISHVDFYQIDMTKPFTFRVPLVFVGESKVVKELEGTLVKSINEIEISCLPTDLPHEVQVDISPLEDYDDNIRIKDLKLSNKITVKTDPNEVVASVARHYVEEAPVVEEAPLAEGEVPAAEVPTEGETTEKAAPAKKE